MLLFTTFWSAKTLHGLIAHHHDHDEEHLVCEVSHDPSTAHIHDDRWAVEDCSICAFLVSIPETYSLHTLPTKFFAKLPGSAPAVFYHAPVCSRWVCDAVMRRGPPA